MPSAVVVLRSTVVSMTAVLVDKTSALVALRSALCMFSVDVGQNVLVGKVAL